MRRGLGFNPGLLGMSWGLGGTSSFLGAVLAERVSKSLGMGRTLIYCSLAAAISTCFIPSAQGATMLSAARLIPVLKSSLRYIGIVRLRNILSRTLEEYGYVQ